MDPGEKPADFDTFDPDRLASRILGMGDVVSLVEKAQETIDQKEAEKMADKLRKAVFYLEDFVSQMQQVKKLGSMESILGMMPGMNGVKLDGDAEKSMARTEAIIRSMTVQERRKPDILNGNRRLRIAPRPGLAQCLGAESVDRTTRRISEKTIRIYAAVTLAVRRVGLV